MVEEIAGVIVLVDDKCVDTRLVIVLVDDKCVDVDGKCVDTRLVIVDVVPGKVVGSE